MIGIGIGLNTKRWGLGIYSTGSWVPTLVLDYKRGVYISAPSPSVTRAGTATYTAADGSIVAASVDTARFDYRGAGGVLNSAARWLLVEGGGTNYVTRSSHTAAFPWNTATTNNGITATLVGTGFVGDVPYADYALTGTNTAASAEPIVSSTFSRTAAVSGQTWTASLYAVLVSGSWPSGRTIDTGVFEENSSNTFLTGSAGSIVLSATAQRLSHTRALNNASTAKVRSNISIGNLGTAGSTTFSGQVIRLYGWQLEQSPVATSLIQTLGGAAVARSQDAVSAIDLTGKIGTSLGVVLDCYLDGVAGATDRLFQLDAGSDTGARVVAYYDRTNSRVAVEVYNASNVLQGSAVFATVLPSRVKLAIRYSANIIQAVCNGSASAIDTSADFMAPQYARIGSNVAGSARPARMGVGQLLIGPAMTEAEAIILGAAA